MLFRTSVLRRYRREDTGEKQFALTQRWQNEQTKLKFHFIFAFVKSLLTVILVSLQIAGLAQISEIETLLKSYEPKKQKAGLAVYSLSGDSIIYQYNASDNFTPASIQKVITTAVALDLLGADFQFETHIAHSGNIDSNGILNGDLYVIGKGDPTLGSKRMKSSIEQVMTRFYEVVQKAGIKQINGQVIADATYYNEELIHPTWDKEDVGNYYGFGASALTINEAQYQLVLKSGKKLGDTIEVLRTEPDLPCISFNITATTAGKKTGDNAYIYGLPFDNNRELSGTIPLTSREFTIKGSMPNPGHYVAFELTSHLINNGILVKGPASYLREEIALGFGKPNDLKIIETLKSDSLINILYWCNKKSVNLFCEHLMKQIAVSQNQEASYANAQNIIAEQLSKNNVDIAGINNLDGSGLSRQNKLQPASMVHVLKYIHNSSIRKDFLATLPVAGSNKDVGTMKYYLKETHAQENLIAKTGYMKGVRSFAGYVTTQSGEKVAFCLIANGPPPNTLLSKKNMLKILQHIAEL